MYTNDIVNHSHSQYLTSSDVGTTINELISTGEISMGGGIKQIIRYIVTSSGNYTKSGLSIDPNKTLVIINGGGYTLLSGANYTSDGRGYANIARLNSITSTTVVTTCYGSGINYSVQIIEFN